MVILFLEFFCVFLILCLFVGLFFVVVILVMSVAAYELSALIDSSLVERGRRSLASAMFVDVTIVTMLIFIVIIWIIVFERNIHLKIVWFFGIV